MLLVFLVFARMAVSATRVCLAKISIRTWAL